jgi:hypothetical protein
MSRKRFSEEVKIEAVQHITERGFAVRDVGDVRGYLLIVCTPGLSNTASLPRSECSNKTRPLENNCSTKALNARFF